ncbi:MAG: DUF6717 family protein [Planctomycetaceae bacterium]
MSARLNTRWKLLATVFVTAVLVGGLATWAYVRSAAVPKGRLMANSNAIMVIAPYWHAGTWVFDDPRVGLEQEPFVAGVPEMIDVLVADVPDAKQGFRLLFSAQPFPEYQKKLTWLRGDMGGNYYKLDDPPMEGWICPAMFQYYEQPPKEIYVKAEALKR